MVTESYAVQLQDIYFQWHRSGPAILDIPELAIQRQERVFIKGPSGSGKSTLLSILGGVLLAQRGKVSILDHDIETFSAAERDHFRAQHIGFIFQMFNLIPYLSVIDNVLLPCRFSKKREANVLDRGSDLQTEAKRLLAHLDLRGDLLQRSVTTLSVGQQQRVAAARALMGRPELVIADEPTSSLDADRREAFLKLLLNECAEQNATLIFVSHDASLESQFDRSIHLDEINRAYFHSAA